MRRPDQPTSSDPPNRQSPEAPVLNDLSALVAVIGIVIVGQGIRVVLQAMVYVVERFGKYTKTLTAGLSFIVPLLDRVQHRVLILEQQLPAFKISVITRDNVEMEFEATVFYRIVDAASSVYRTQDVDRAIDTAASSIVRSAVGRGPGPRRDVNDY